MVVNAKIKPLSVVGTAVLFGIPTIYFLLVTSYIIPYFNTSLGFHPALSWFAGGLAVFVPLFLCALILARLDIAGFSRKEILQRLRLKKPTKSDMKWVGSSLIIIFALTGIIMFASELICSYFNLPALKMSPDFIKFDALAGNERYLLLVWLVMFFFNIVGEEILWRGYILPRQELRFGRFAWILNSIFWLLFHVCFGIDLMIILLPAMIILPYIVQKTGNTTNGILIHAIYNGPLFVFVALGVIK